MIPVILLFVELSINQRILDYNLLSPLKILANNFSSEKSFTINNSAIAGFMISAFGVVAYTYFLVNYIKISIKLPFVYYFWNNSNKNTFLRNEVKNLKLKNIFKILRFYFLVFRILNNKNFAIKDEGLALYAIPKNLYQKFLTLNAIFKRNIWEENFVKNITSEEGKFIKFYINQAKLTSVEIVKKFQNISKEVEKLFSNTDFEGWIQINSQKFSEIEVLIFNKKTLWENRNLDFSKISLKKWELLLWFYQKIANWVENLDYKIFSKSLNHFLISASSRSGKNQLVDNIAFSLLWNIQKFSNFELHFFDTKWVDASYLENMKNYGIFRYKSIPEYKNIFAKLVEEMRKNSKIVENYSNIYNYNEKNLQNPIKEKFIIINEFLSLNNSLPTRELNELLGYIVTLTSEWAGFGYKVIIMSQTLRKDSSNGFSEILANMKSRFILKAFNLEEVRINAKWLAEEDVARIMNMKLYNCFHIEDNEIKQEFKAFYFTQEDLKKWISENFEVKNTHNFSDKIQDYYNFSQKNEWISFKEAIEKFNFTRTEWDKFVKILEKNHEIKRLSNNSIIWKK